jgi:mRNA interferase MazF
MQKFIKRFQEWIILKSKLDQSSHKAPFVKERDIWWCQLGENIGTEVSGKGDKFSRPVIILKRLSRWTYLVIPTTTKNKTGTWYVAYEYQGKTINACLQQVRTIDYRRLHNKMGSLNEIDFDKVKKGFIKLYK